MQQSQKCVFFATGMHKYHTYLVLHKCHTHPRAHTHTRAHIRAHTRPGTCAQAHTREHISKTKTKRTKRKRITNQEQTRTKRETMQAAVKMFSLVIAQGRCKLLILKINKKRLTYVAVFDLLVSAKTKRLQTN